MGFFIVHLKEGSELLKIEADKFYIEDGVFLFYKDGGGENIAGIPVSNVLSVVKEQK